MNTRKKIDEVFVAQDVPALRQIVNTWVDGGYESSEEVTSDIQGICPTWNITRDEFREDGFTVWFTVGDDPKEHKLDMTSR